MDGPLFGRAGSFQCLAPLAKAGLFADVDLLAGANQSDQYAPLGDALTELDKGLRLRLVLRIPGCS